MYFLFQSIYPDLPSPIMAQKFYPSLTATCPLKVTTSGLKWLLQLFYNLILMPLNGMKKHCQKGQKQIEILILYNNKMSKFKIFLRLFPWTPFWLLTVPRTLPHILLGTPVSFPHSWLICIPRPIIRNFSLEIFSQEYFSWFSTKCKQCLVPGTTLPIYTPNVHCKENIWFSSSLLFYIKYLIFKSFIKYLIFYIILYQIIYIYYIYIYIIYIIYIYIYIQWSWVQIPLRPTFYSYFK